MSSNMEKMSVMSMGVGVKPPSPGPQPILARLEHLEKEVYQLKEDLRRSEELVAQLQSLVGIL